MRSCWGSRISEHSVPGSEPDGLVDNANYQPGFFCRFTYPRTCDPETNRPVCVLYKDRPTNLTKKNYFFPQTDRRNFRDQITTDTHAVIMGGSTHLTPHNARGQWILTFVKTTNGVSPSSVPSCSHRDHFKSKKRILPRCDEYNLPFCKKRWRRD